MTLRVCKRVLCVVCFRLRRNCRNLLRTFFVFDHLCLTISNVLELLLLSKRQKVNKNSNLSCLSLAVSLSLSGV
jgi:hypothetical protein